MIVSFLLRLLFSLLVVRGATVKVLATFGGRVEFPCRYEYEDAGAIQELSVQWKGPRHQLLCHFIKHKAFHNCTRGYAMGYQPGRITLVIAEVTAADAGPHLCSVSKRHAFSDFITELRVKPQSTTEAPVTNKCTSGSGGRHLALFSCVLVLCFWER